MTIADIYTFTVALYEKTHHYHILTLARHTNLHRELGDQYEALVDARDTLGEQLIINGLPVETPRNAIYMNSYEADTPRAMCMELITDNIALREALFAASRSADVDEGTRTILADRLIAHGKMIAKLKSVANEFVDID